MLKSKTIPVKANSMFSKRRFTDKEIDAFKGLSFKGVLEIGDCSFIGFLNLIIYLGAALHFPVMSLRMFY